MPQESAKPGVASPKGRLRRRRAYARPAHAARSRLYAAAAASPIHASAATKTSRRCAAGRVLMAPRRSACSATSKTRFDAMSNNASVARHEAAQTRYLRGRRVLPWWSSAETAVVVFRGDGSRRRRGHDVDIPRRRRRPKQGFLASRFRRGRVHNHDLVAARDHGRLPPQHLARHHPRHHDEPHDRHAIERRRERGSRRAPERRKTRFAPRRTTREHEVHAVRVLGQIAK